MYKEYVEVEKDFMYYAFLQWYRDNIGEAVGETVTPADRRVHYSPETRELIGYIDFYMENTYYIEKIIYEKWVS